MGGSAGISVEELQIHHQHVPLNTTETRSYQHKSRNRMDAATQDSGYSVVHLAITTRLMPATGCTGAARNTHPSSERRLRIAVCADAMNERTTKDHIVFEFTEDDDLTERNCNKKRGGVCGEGGKRHIQNQKSFEYRYQNALRKPRKQFLMRGVSRNPI